MRPAAHCTRGREEEGDGDGDGKLASSCLESVSFSFGLMFPSHQELVSPDVLVQISMCILLVATIDCQGRRSKVVVVVVMSLVRDSSPLPPPRSARRTTLIIYIFFLFFFFYMKFDKCMYIAVLIFFLYICHF